jgi:hypothetical protein
VSVAAKLRTTGFTVGLWRNRFIVEGIAGLGDEPRPGAPREIGDEKVEQVVRLTMGKTPKGATHWSSARLPLSTYSGQLAWLFRAKFAALRLMSMLSAIATAIHSHSLQEGPRGR